jgi:para-aminobenzoate synthetase component 2
MAGTRILVVDNYDSFVFNLVHYLAELGAEPEVVRNDAVDPAAVLAERPAGVLVSPGPGRPEDAGACVPLIRRCAGAAVPVLGVCLGHQAVAVAFGGDVGPAAELRHGKTSEIHHGGAGVFAGLPDPFAATRYHSLIVREATLPAELEVSARTADGTIMGLRHRALPVEGVQFHPESVLTRGGYRLLGSWLAGCGEAGAPQRAAELDERLAGVAG